jgi:hypothetical protein
MISSDQFLIASYWYCLYLFECITKNGYETLRTRQVYICIVPSDCKPHGFKVCQERQERRIPREPNM